MKNDLEFQSVMERAWRTLNRDDLQTMVLAFERLYLAASLTGFKDYHELISGFLRVSRRLEKDYER